MRSNFENACGEAWIEQQIGHIGIFLFVVAFCSREESSCMVGAHRQVLSELA